MTHHFAHGTSRFVLCIGALAFKFARHAQGAECNRFEAEIYRRAIPSRRAMLCPPLWCSKGVEWEALHDGKITVGQELPSRRERAAIALKGVHRIRDFSLMTSPSTTKVP
jgi:hypothetical protein